MAKRGRPSKVEVVPVKRGPGRPRKTVVLVRSPPSFAWAVREAEKMRGTQTVPQLTQSLNEVNKLCDNQRAEIAVLREKVSRLRKFRGSIKLVLALADAD